MKLYYKDDNWTHHELQMYKADLTWLNYIILLYDYTVLQLIMFTVAECDCCQVNQFMIKTYSMIYARVRATANCGNTYFCKEIVNIIRYIQSLTKEEKKEN